MDAGFIKFLGTGGARFVVSKQIRATAGLWLRYLDTNLYIDPGPGAIVRIRSSKMKLEPELLDGIILTHKHLDHSNDVNVLIEAMTEGGFKKRGILFCPKDAITGEAVVLSSFLEKLEGFEIMEEGKEYELKDVKFETPVRHVHPVETYGILFHLNVKIGLISDTRYFDGLTEAYRSEILIVNVLRSKPIGKNDEIDHLSIPDFMRLISEIRPRIAIMTHFGLGIIREKPHMLAAKIKEETGLNVVAAYDGMEIRF